MNSNTLKHKLIAIDLDGTLLTSDNEVSKENIEALKKLNQLGCKCIIATGRHLKSTINLVKEWNIPALYVIAANGAVIYDNKKDKIIQEYYLENKYILEFIEYIKKYQTIFLISGSKFHLSSIKANDKFWQRESIAKTNLPIYAYNEKIINSKEKFYKIMIIFSKDPKINEQITDDCKNKFAKYFEFCQAKASDGIIFTVINKKDISKAKALKAIAKKLNTNLDEIIAIGDSGNDISMFKISDLSFAPKSGTEQAKKEAKIIIDKTHDEHLIKHVYNYLTKND